MIGIKELRKRAHQQYHSFLRSWLETENGFFPVEISLGKPAKHLQQFQNDVRSLQNNQNKGYKLRQVTRKISNFGEQTFPTHALFPDQTSYLRFIGKQKEFEHFIHEVDHILARLGLYIWVRDNVELILNHLGDWEAIVHVCEYFKENPQPNLYLRELPIPVHTKFIETHRGIVASMLKHILPEEDVDPTGKSFEERFGLQKPEPLIRFRILDDNLLALTELPFNDMSVPLPQLQAYSLAPYSCLIVENQMSFLTLPTIPDTFAIYGMGMSGKPQELSWLNDCPVYFWGDLDVQGFQILSSLRQVFPHTQSILMDESTLQEHAEFLVKGKRIPQTRLSHLTSAEHHVFNRLRKTNQRLEQERIGYFYALAKFEEHLGI